MRCVELDENSPELKQRLHLVLPDGIIFVGELRSHFQGGLQHRLSKSIVGSSRRRLRHPGFRFSLRSGTSRALLTVKDLSNSVIDCKQKPEWTERKEVRRREVRQEQESERTNILENGG